MNQNIEVSQPNANNLYFLLFSAFTYASGEDAQLSGAFDLVAWRSQGVGLWAGEIFLANAADNALVV